MKRMGEDRSGSRECGIMSWEAHILLSLITYIVKCTIFIPS